MRRSRTISLAEALQDYISEMKIGSKLKEAGAVASWENIVGKAIASRTTRIYIKDSVLFVHLNSSVVRNELMMIREGIRERINREAGSEIIRDIILR
jgi:predicted nucleic acid-binding Zn ribbon protein